MSGPGEGQNNDEGNYEVIDIYDDPSADTIIIYDNDGDQHVEIREE